MHRVRLINRAASHGQTGFPVCGISTKNYGQSALRPEFNGFVFEMSLEDYDRDKFDLIGNPDYQQQWVPEFIEVQAAVAPESEEPIRDPELVAINTLRKEKSLRERAKAAGVWKKGMTEEQIKEALGFPD